MKGERSNPHRAEDVRQKYFDVMTPVWGEARAAALYREILSLEAVADMRAFGQKI
jgi:hypothetical protein